MENTDRDHGQTDEPTQGENPGAQGDFGAGQGEPGEGESIADADSDETFEDNFADHTNLAGNGAGGIDPGDDDPTVGRDGDRVEGTEQPRVDDVDGGGAGEIPMDAAGEDEPMAPYDRDPGEDATMTNGGNATR